MKKKAKRQPAVDTRNRQTNKDGEDLSSEPAKDDQYSGLIYTYISKNIYGPRAYRLCTVRADPKREYACYCNKLPPLAPRCVSREECANKFFERECSEKTCFSKDLCQNRGISKRKGAAVEVREAGNKGLGLFALEDIHDQSLVVEYRGEVILSEETDERDQKHPDDFYFVSFDKGTRTIDARYFGNVARFINHSCDPNLVIHELWTVVDRVGDIRVGLFPKPGKKISKGDELTFDYALDPETNEGREGLECKCGSANCRGTMLMVENPESKPSLEPVSLPKESSDNDPLFPFEVLTRALITLRLSDEDHPRPGNKKEMKE